MRDIMIDLIELFLNFLREHLKKGERFLIIFQKNGSKMLYKRILLKKTKKK